MGLDIDYFYSVTPRIFLNILNGYRRKEDMLSRERWVMTRKLMFSSMAPYLPKHIKENEVLELPWEKEAVQEMTEQETAEMLEQIEKQKTFWKRFDESQKA